MLDGRNCCEDCMFFNKENEIIFLYEIKMKFLNLGILINIV